MRVSLLPHELSEGQKRSESNTPQSSSVSLSAGRTVRESAPHMLEMDVRVVVVTHVCTRAGIG